MVRHTLVALLAAALIAPIAVEANAQSMRDQISVAAAPKLRIVRKKKRKKGPTKTKNKKKKGKTLEKIPVDIGVGPALHYFTGPVQDDQSPHYGISLKVAAIIKQAVIKRHQGKIPKKFRKLLRKPDEIRISPGPAALIPDTIYLSPKTEQTGIYGLNLRPIALTIPLIKVPRLAVGLGLDFTYLYIDSDKEGVNEERKDDFRETPDVALTTHFLRPGLDLRASLEVPLSESFLVEVGWTSYFYPPQQVGGDIFKLGDADDSIWHIGQAFLKLHFRFPYSIRI